MPDPAVAVCEPSESRGLETPCDSELRPPPFARHDLCRLNLASQSLTSDVSIHTIDLHPPRSSAEDEAARIAILNWATREHPFVVTRQDSTRPSTHWKLALCGPRPAVPRRFAFEVAANVIRTAARPVRLARAIHAAPDDWRPALRALDQAFADIGLTARTFGSLAWQAITNLSYLHARSDIDLIVEITSDAWRAAFTPEGRLTAAFTQLEAVIDAAPFRCDCELRLDDDAACSLAELRLSSRQVLVKRNDRNMILTRQELRELGS